MAKSVGNEGSASVNWGRLNSARSASTTRMRSGSLAIWRFLPEYFVLVAVRRIPLGGGGGRRVSASADGLFLLLMMAAAVAVALGSGQDQDLS